ncbi:MAG: hypothetical protein FD180_2462 [Planctomycetota bacterium]|nr:MAG: hypothetical protein FD180_2462 [Planctomycetota bacterium]
MNLPTPQVRILSISDIRAYIAFRREMLLDAPWAFMASPGFDGASLGFKAWGREPDALRLNGRAFSEVHMSLALRRNKSPGPGRK